MHRPPLLQKNQVFVQRLWRRNRYPWSAPVGSWFIVEGQTPQTFRQLVLAQREQNERIWDIQILSAGTNLAEPATLRVVRRA